MNKCDGRKHIPKITTNANTVTATFRRAFTCNRLLKRANE